MYSSRNVCRWSVVSFFKIKFEILYVLIYKGIKLGRKPKSEKLFETNGEIQLSKTSKNESEQSVYFSEEFKRWLHLKVEYGYLLLIFLSLLS